MFPDPGDFWRTDGFGGYRTLLYFGPARDLEIVIPTNGGAATGQRRYESSA